MDRSGIDRRESIPAFAIIYQGECVFLVGDVVIVIISFYFLSDALLSSVSMSCVGED